MTLRDRLRDWLGVTPPAPPAARVPMSLRTDAALGFHSSSPAETWRLPTMPLGVVPAGQMAMDDAQMAGFATWAGSGVFSEGLGFLGYAYLAELSQRPEYRRMSEIIASEATRKWIRLEGGDEAKLKEIEKAMKRFRVREVFREVAEHDGLFGRGQIFIDMGAANRATPLVATENTVGRGKLKALRAIEPQWSYPFGYDTTDPTSAKFYKPQTWYVMGKEVHASRMLTIAGREMPDILKPAYAFGGLSLSQMAKPYVDNWLRARQSVSDLLHSFSTMVLKTNLSQVLTGGATASLVARAQLFNQARDNRGLMIVDMETEALENVTTPLGTLDSLLAMAQEQLASVCGIPLIVLLGITPSGLNASSDGEMRAFYGTIKAYQERVFREHIHTILDLIQLSEFGEIDDTVHFEFHDLWEVSEADAALIRKSDSETDCNYVNTGIVSADETRDLLGKDERGRYYGIDLTGPAPEPPEESAPEIGAHSGKTSGEGTKAIPHTT